MSTVNCLQNQAWNESEQASSAANTTPETIGFFSLPRELRDDIYDLLYLEDEHKPNGLDKAEIIKGKKHGYMVYTQTSILPARLVSRQFKSEYEERPASGNRAQLTSNMVLECWGNNISWCPTISNRCTELEVHYYQLHQTAGPCVWCQGCVFLGLASLRRLDYFVHGSRLLQRVRIRLHCPGPDLGCDGSAWEDHCCTLDNSLRKDSGFALSKSLGDRVCSRLGQLDVEISWHGRESGIPGKSLRFGTWMAECSLQVDVNTAIRCQNRIVRT
jgi:hypothetical protein